MLAVTTLSACGDSSEASGKPATSVTSKPEFALYALSRGKGVPAPTRAALEKAHVLLEDARQRGAVLALKQTRIGLEGETRLCVEAKDAARVAALLTDEGYPVGSTGIVGRLERFSSDYSRVIVAEMDGEILGFVALHVLPRFEHDDRIVRVLALVVDPGVRERGVGHLLMAEAERVGGEVGAAFVEVTAGHHRPDAQRLFESLGYDASVTTYLRKRL